MDRNENEPVVDGEPVPTEEQDGEATGSWDVQVPLDDVA